MLCVAAVNVSVVVRSITMGTMVIAAIMGITEAAEEAVAAALRGEAGGGTGGEGGRRKDVSARRWSLERP